MDTASIDAALPAAVVAAVTGDDQGLTDVSQVYVAAKRRDMGSNAIEAWLRPLADTPQVLKSRPSSNLVAYALELRITAADGSSIDWVSLGDQILAGFHHVALAIANMITCEVSDLAYEQHQGEGVAEELRATLTYVGWRDR